MTTNTQEQVPHVCVIGAGVCGLVSVKICLESGLRVTCYDKSFKYGGLWNYRPDVDDLEAPFEPSVMRTTILNTSKELSSFSDFPPPPTVANFMRHDYYMAYIDSYVHQFKLLEHIHLGHEIISCSPRWERSPQDNNAAIKWLVKVRDLTSLEVKSETYDRLMVAVGHHNIPYAPSYPNQSRFKGRVLHSARLKNILTNPLFVDKRVLVVGFGNSACDAANDLAMVASKCYVSCHRGQWFTGRLLRDEPYDFRIKSRAHHYLTKCLSTSQIDSAIIERVEERVNHRLLGLEPKHKPSEQVPAINDLFPYRVYTGGIVLKGAVREFTESGVVFEGEEGEEQPIDIVVFATGYEAKITFLDELELGLRSRQHNNEYDLFLNIFAPNFKLPIVANGNSNSATCYYKGTSPLAMPNGDLSKLPDTPTPWEAIKSLAFIGLVQPNGSLTVISELQARYATLVFKGDKELPSMSEMMQHMELTRKMRSKSIRSHSRDQLIGSYVGYMETLARLIGARPNLTKLFFSDHKLWRRLMFGPCVPYQYRLTGPGCWPEARSTVLSTSERVYCGINEGKNHILYKSRRKCLSGNSKSANGLADGILSKSLNSTK